MINHYLILIGITAVGSPRDLATRQLIGEYKRDFDEVVTHS